MQKGFQVTLYKKTTQETTQETVQEIVKKISTRENILKAMKENRNITRDELSVVVNVSSSAVKQHLANLKKDGIIKRVGSTKSGYWEVLDENEYEANENISHNSGI